MLKEGVNVEFKEVINDKLERTIISFLNTTGGNLYIGINDDGEIVGLENIDEQMLQVKNKIRDSILPSTLGLFEIKIEEQNGNKYLNITVSRGNEKPYYLRSKGMIPDGCFIRIGSATEKMTPQMIEDLFSTRARNSLKNISSPDQNLTFKELKIFYNELGKDVGENLIQHLDLINADGKYNYVAYLMSDNNKLSFKVAKYMGIDSFDLIENNEFGNGCLVKIAKKVLDKLDLENKTFTKITAKNREEVRQIDSIAMKEAVINAFVHNDYSNEYPPKFELFDNRLEITSTGGLPSNFTKEDFLGGFSAPRNKEIIRVFQQLGLVEHLGTGVRRILRVYPEDVFNFYPNFLRVRFDFKSNPFGNLKCERNKSQKESNKEKILNTLKRSKKITIKEISMDLSLNERTVARYMKELLQSKIITRVGSNKNGHWEVN